LTFTYYFRRYNVTNKGIFLTLFISIVILAAILYGIITGLIDVAAWFELLFVNNFGLPFNSGVLFFALLLVGGIVGGLLFTRKNNRPVLHHLILAFAFILMGYSTITTSVIRSNANTNINMNSPKDIVSLASYLKREQYGKRPFLTGYYYTAQPVDYKVTGKRYAKGKNKYDIVGERFDYVYSKKARTVLFPRIYDGNYKKQYQQWLGLRKGEKPSYGNNIAFFFNYQIWHMYFRYLFWNYVGRQNDEQGVGGPDNGNWISGISFIDSMRLGSQANLPDHFRNAPSRNVYYFLPLLLAILGILFHFMNDKRRATAVALLFFFTGLMIIIQGNSPPIEPRERDYIFAGSFWAFCIWIGLGVLALYDILRGRVGSKTLAAGIAVGFCTLIPVLMGFQNWDDHTRANRYVARDFAYNYLDTCAPNAIIFTQGDNDTYPLWYAQEVEGFRRDVRVVNLNLLGVDWYNEQLRYKTNDAAPVDFTLSQDKIRGSRRDVVSYVENPNIPADRYLDLIKIMEFIGDDSKAVQQNGEAMSYFPTKNFRLEIDKQAIQASGAIAPKDYGKIVDEIQWTLPGRSLVKNNLMVLDIIAANAKNGWKRPIYFAISVSPESHVGLSDYFQLEGLAYRLVPVKKEDPKDPQNGRVRADVMYENVMNKFKFGNIDKEGVYIDSDLKRMLFNFRGNFSRLSDALISAGENEKAIEVADKCLEVIPNSKMSYDVYFYTLVENYLNAGAKDKASALAEQIAENMASELKYYKDKNGSIASFYKKDIETNSVFLQQFMAMAKRYKMTDLENKLETLFQEIGI